MQRLLLLSAALSLLACTPPSDGPDSGQGTDAGTDAGEVPTGDFGGRLVLSAGSPAVDRVAIVWNDFRVNSDGGVVFATPQNGERVGDRFYFQLPGGPPEHTRTPSGNFEGDAGRVSIGTVVAYQDLNGNGVLDVIPPGGGPIDAVVGVSSNFYGRNDVEEQQPVSAYVLFVDGLPPDRPAGLVSGFNVVIDEQVVPAETEIQVPVRPSPFHNLYLCSGQSPTPGGVLDESVQNGCMGPAEFRLFASLSLFNAAESATISLFGPDGDIIDAAVFVNDQPLELSPLTGGYYLYGTGFLRYGAENTVLVQRDGFPDHVETIWLAPDFSFVSPAANAELRWDEPMTVEWTPSAGAHGFEVRQVVRFPERGRSRSVLTSATSHTFPALSTDPGTTPIPTQLELSTYRRTYDEDGSSLLDSSIFHRRNVSIVR